MKIEKGTAQKYFMNFDHRELLFMEEKNYSSWSLEETGEFLAYKVRELDTDTDIVCEIRR